MVTVGQFDYCILNGLAYTSALDMVSRVPLGKEFISDVSFIILHKKLPLIQIGRRWPFGIIGVWDGGRAYCPTLTPNQWRNEPKHLEGRNLCEGA